MTNENLKVAFDHFDTDGIGEITPKTISKCFIWASKEIDEKEIEEMIHEVSGKDTINFEEFIWVMKDSD